MNVHLQLLISKWHMEHSWSGKSKKKTHAHRIYTIDMSWYVMICLPFYKRDPGAKKAYTYCSCTAWWFSTSLLKIAIGDHPPK